MPRGVAEAGAGAGAAGGGRQVAGGRQSTVAVRPVPAMVSVLGAGGGVLLPLLLLLAAVRQARAGAGVDCETLKSQFCSSDACQLHPSVAVVCCNCHSACCPDKEGESGDLPLKTVRAGDLPVKTVRAGPWAGEQL